MIHARYTRSNSKRSTWSLIDLAEAFMKWVSKLPVVLCRTLKNYNYFFYDYYFWRRVPKSQHNRWVDRCDELDRRIDRCFQKKCHIIGEITFWRDRAVEVTVPQLSDKRLTCLQGLLRGRYSDWRIDLSIWTGGRKNQHIGGMLIDRDDFIISRGLAPYFPNAEIVTRRMIEQAEEARNAPPPKRKKS